VVIGGGNGHYRISTKEERGYKGVNLIFTEKRVKKLLSLML